MSKYLKDELSSLLHGPLVTSAVTVSGGPTLLPPSSLKQRKDIIVFNDGPSIVYMGGSTVSEATGIPVESDASFSLTLGRGELFATVSGNDTHSYVRIFEAT